MSTSDHLLELEVCLGLPKLLHHPLQLHHVYHGREGGGGGGSSYQN